MKILLQHTLQAILDCEFFDHTPNATDSYRSASIQARHVLTFPTRLGPIQLGLPVAGRHRHATDLFARYNACERVLLFELKRILLHGLTSVHSARAMAEELCGHALSPAGASCVAATLEREVALHYRRQLATEHPSCALGSRLPW